MKTILIVIGMVLFITSFTFAGDVSVKGYWRDSDRDGLRDTFVQPHHRTSPNDSLSDNYGTRGNINPYTGNPGTVNPTPMFK